MFLIPRLCLSDLGCVFQTSVVFFRFRLCFSDLGSVFQTSYLPYQSVK